jgi:hypothetical protein
MRAALVAKYSRALGTSSWAAGARGWRVSRAAITGRAPCVKRAVARVSPQRCASRALPWTACATFQMCSLAW